jgi:hypothetical protein
MIDALGIDQTPWFKAKPGKGSTKAFKWRHFRLEP